MSYRHTYEAALESLKEIEQLICNFPDNGYIPSIEIDLALQKMRNVYELMLMVKQETAVTALLKTTVSKEQPVADATTESEKNIVTEKNAKTLPAESVAVVEETIPAAVPEPEPVKSDEQTRPVVKSAKAKKEPKTLADQFQGTPTLHEQLHQKMTKEEDTISHAKPVRNLMEAIGINDRYTFVRELFSGDNAKFESAIHFLNEAASFNDAYNYMIMYFNWDMDSEPVQLLLDIIRRKFIKSRHE